MQNLSPSKIIIFFVAMLILTACGGGGSGSGSGSDGLVYSGLTTQAIITSDNADDIATASLSTGTSGTIIIGPVASAATESGSNSITPAAVLTASSVKEIIEKLDLSSFPTTGISNALMSESETLSGGCSGNLRVSIQLDDETGAFNGSMVFDEYCEYYVLMDGSATFSGVIDLDTANFLDMSIRFNKLTSTSSDESFTMDGIIDVDMSTASEVMTMNMLVGNNLSGEVYRMEGFTVTSEDMGTDYQLQMNGRFYDPAYGYVTLSTPSPFQGSWYADFPYAGQMVMTGENGSSGGATSARLTALNSSQCQLEVDIDGDGNYDGSGDYSSGSISWDEL